MAMCIVKKCVTVSDVKVLVCTSFKKHGIIAQVVLMKSTKTESCSAQGEAPRQRVAQHKVKHQDRELLSTR